MFSRLALKMALILAIAGGAVAVRFYIKSLNTQLELAAEKQARMDDVINSQQMAMEAVQNNLKAMQEAQSELNGKLSEAEQGRRSLEVKFNQTKDGQTRNIGAMANKEPQRVEDSINRGTKDAGRCNEIISGSPLTQDEKDGKIKNSICPDLLPAVTAETATKSSTTFDPSKIKRAK